MGTNTLVTSFNNGDVIDPNHINQYASALQEDFVGRDTNSIAAAGKNLGNSAFPWGTVHANNIVLNNQALDVSQITTALNRIVSGKTRTQSSLPMFLKPNTGLDQCIIEGSSDALVLSINGTSVTINADINIENLTLAPSANNTALINDVDIVNDKFAGEIDYTYNEKKGFITLDNAGSEVTSLVGSIVAFKATNEILFGYLESSEKITNVFRGYFFDDNQDPIVREELNDNDTLTILSLGWVFIEDNGATIDVSYLTPAYSFQSPSSPVAGQYWFDISNQTWKRYSGTQFEIINRILVGVVAMDDVACIAARSFDFSNSFGEFNNIDVDIKSSEIVSNKALSSRVNVYGTEVIQEYADLSWNITTDLESGLIETIDTEYFLYLSDQGQPIISNEKPFDRKDLRGFYHPYHSWRCVGDVFNNSSSDLVFVCSMLYNKDISKKIVQVSDQKPSGTDGGTFTGGSYQTRELNTLKGDKSFCSLDSNVLTLAKGSYSFNGYATAQGVNRNKARLQNTTDNTTAIVGSPEVTSSGDNTSQQSLINDSFIINKTTNFELQHRCNTSGSGDGFGQGSSYGENEIFSMLKIIKYK